MDENERKRILIDVTSLFDQYSKRGIGRYTRDLLSRLLKLFIEEENWDIHLLGFNDLQQNLMEIGFSKFTIEEIVEEFTFHSLGEMYPSSYQNIFDWKYIENIIYEVEPDIYFATHFERGLPTVRRLKSRYMPKKTVVTVHDVIPLVNNQFSRKNPIVNILKGIFYRFMWTGVEEADLILTCSEFSRKDLVNYGHIPESNIEVIYLGINRGFYREEINKLSNNERNEVLERFKVKDKSYFFYDSGLESNKGIDNLIEILDLVFEQNNEEIPNNILIIGGDFYQGVGEDIEPRSELGEIYYRKLKKRGLLEKVITTSRIPDEELQILLANSKAYIYLSNYEGFGFGPVQAMAAEIPTIVNNSSCLPEITRGASLLVNASNHEETANQIIEMLSDKNKLQNLIDKGKEVAPNYNWDTTAEQSLKAIKELFTEEE